MSFLPNKQQIIDEAANYNALSFFKKSKNIYAAFIIFCCVVTFGFMVYTNNLSLTEFISNEAGIASLITVSIYLLFAFFVYLNHRWAMIIFCLLFLADKILMLLAGGSFSNIIFAGITLVLTIASIRVANQLKRLKLTK